MSIFCTNLLFKLYGEIRHGEVRAAIYGEQQHFTVGIPPIRLLCAEEEGGETMASLALPSVTATQAAKPGPPPALSPPTPNSVRAVIFSQSLETSRTALRCRINKGRQFSSRPLRNPSAVAEQSATVCTRDLNLFDPECFGLVLTSTVRSLGFGTKFRFHFYSVGCA